MVTRAAAAMVVAVACTALVSCESSTSGQAAAPTGTVPPDLPTSASSTPPTTTVPSIQVDIPRKRATMPRRPKPLTSPAKCRYRESPEPPAKEAKPPKQTSVPARGKVNVVLRTSVGEIGLRLDRALAPCAVNSFLSLIQQEFYDDTECHRLGVEGLQMLQCGDPSANGTGDPGYTVPDENFTQIRYGRGILAMARSQQPNSGGSQFFLVYGRAVMHDGTPLPPEYTVFGSITDAGLRVLDKVARGGVDPAAAAESADGTGKPAIPVRFTGVTVIGP